MKQKFNEYIIPPGETLKELLETKNITSSELSLKIKTEQKIVDGIIDGTEPITKEIADKFSKVFNIPSSFWNNLEKNYRDTLEREKNFYILNN